MMRQTNLPVKIHRIRYTTQAASIGATAIPSTNIVRMYRVSYNICSDSAGLNGSTVQVTIKFAYNGVVHSFVGSVMNLNLSLTESSNFLFWHDGSAGQPSITYEVNFIVGGGTRTYFFGLIAERISTG